MRDELLQLMVKFQLCYQISGTDGQYIAPQLLEPEPPAYKWDEQANLHLQYRYKFMPKGVINNLTVRLHRYIWQQTYVWQTGLILARDGTLAEIEEIYAERRIRIRVRGRQPRDLLRTIIDAMEAIHQSYQHLDYDMLVPCNCRECIRSDVPYFYQYDRLRERQARGRETVECEESYIFVEVTALLEATLGSWVDHQWQGLGLPSRLKSELTNVLNRCPQFESQQALQSLFVDSRIAPWKNRLPEGNDVGGRVELLISRLHQQYNRQNENALLLFLEVLRDNTHAEDGLHGALTQLVEQVRGEVYGDSA